MDALMAGNKSFLSGLENQRRQLIEEQIVRRKRIHNWIIRSDDESKPDTSTNTTNITGNETSDSEVTPVPAKQSSSSSSSSSSFNNSSPDNFSIAANISGSSSVKDQSVQTETLDENEYLRHRFEHNRRRLQIRFDQQLVAQRRRQHSHEHLQRLHQRALIINSQRHFSHRQKGKF